MDLPVLHVDARFDQRRRGRTDARADRAAGVVAGDPRHGRDPAGRRQRDDRSLSLHPAAAAPACRADLFAAGTADRRSHQICPGRGPGKRRICADRCAGRQAGRDPHCQRQRGHAVPRCARPTGCRRRQDACRQHAVMGAVRGAGGGISRQRAAALGDGAVNCRGRLAAGLAALCRGSRRRAGHRSSACRHR